MCYLFLFIHPENHPRHHDPDPVKWPTVALSMSGKTTAE